MRCSFVVENVFIYGMLASYIRCVAYYVHLSATVTGDIALLVGLKRVSCLCLFVLYFLVAWLLPLRILMFSQFAEYMRYC